MYVTAGRIGDDFNYLTMQLVGPNLDSLRRRCPLVVKRFSTNTAMRLASQCLESIRDLHKVGWVHRDIKAVSFAFPSFDHKLSLFQSNFAMGGSAASASIVYLLDYGLCREHI